MRLSKKDIGSYVEVKFLDHAENTKGPVYTEARGRLVSYDRKAIHLCSWESPRNPELKDDNNTDYYILRRSIEEIAFMQNREVRCQT